MLNAIIILSALLFFAIMFAIACLVHAKYTTEALKIMTEYANSLKKTTDSLFTNQKSMIDNHIELLNRFTNLSQWTINQGLCAEEAPAEEEEDDAGQVQEVYDLDDIDTDLIDKIVDEVVDNYQANNGAEE